MPVYQMEAQVFFVLLVYISGGSKGGGKGLGIKPPPAQKKIITLFRGFHYDLVTYWVRNTAQYALDCMRKPSEI